MLFLCNSFPELSFFLSWVFSAFPFGLLCYIYIYFFSRLVFIYVCFGLFHFLCFPLVIFWFCSQSVADFFPMVFALLFFCLICFFDIGSFAFNMFLSLTEKRFHGYNLFVFNLFL